jgi:hypothetical protein
MRVKWFIAGWLGHSVAAYVLERVRSHREWLAFERELSQVGKSMIEDWGEEMTRGGDDAER